MSTSKMGCPFTFDTALEEAVRNLMCTRGVTSFNLRWTGTAKEHMKWAATCNNPRNTSITSIERNIVEFGATPHEAVRKVKAHLDHDRI